LHHPQRIGSSAADRDSLPTFYLIGPIEPITPNGIIGMVVDAAQSLE